MKKYCLFLLVFFMTVLFSNSLFAQNKAYGTHVSYKDMRYPAVAIQIDVAADIVRVALEEDLKHRGLKGKSSSNFKIYENVVFPLISRNAMSFYTLVENIATNTSLTEKSVVYIIAININPVRFIDESTDVTVFNNIKYYLEDFETSARKTHLEVKINDQFKTVERLERRISSLTNDSIVIQRRRNELDQKSKEIEKSLIIQRNSLNVQKAILDDLYKRKQQNK